MPVTGYHVKTATSPDDPLFEVNPSNWNSEHAMSLSVLATEISGLFSNKNGVSFGLDGTNITGSIAAGAAPGSISAGTTNYALGEVIFSNANGVSFGLDGQTVTATVKTDYLTTAMASNRGSDFVQATANFFGTSASGTIASNAISVSIGPYITTAMASNRGSDFVAATAVFNGTNATGTIASNAISVSVAAQSNQSIGLYASSNTTLTSSGTADARSLTFRGIGGVSVGVSASEVLISGPQTVAQTNQTLGIYASSNTTMTSSGTIDARSLSIRGAGIASVGYSNNEVLISVPAGAPSPVNFSAGTTSNNLGSVVFSNSNNVSFGLDGSTITASASFAGGGGIGGGVSNLGNTAGSTGTVTTGNIVFVGSGPISLSQSTGAAGSNATISINAPATSSIVGSNGVSVSTNGSTISVMLSVMSSYENIPSPVNASYSLAGGSTNGSISHAVAFQLAFPMSASFIRFPVSMTTRSTTFATTGTANANVSAQMRSTWNVVLYSLGGAGSSQSLQMVTSTSFGATWMNSMSITNSTQYSVTQAFTFGNRGNGSTHTTQYSISNTNYSLVSTFTVMHSQASGNRLLDIPFAVSLTPGNYWLVFGLSSSSLTNSTNFTALTRCCVEYSTGGYVSGSNVSWGEMGQTNLTSGGLMGAGSFSTAGGGTTASIPISAISSFASNLRPLFQLIRSA